MIRQHSMLPRLPGVRALLLAAALWSGTLPGAAPGPATPAAQTTPVTQAPPATQPAAQAQWDGIARVVAFADVHGAFPQLQQLLRESGIIDAQGRWTAGNAHVVSLGDLIDRGAGSRQVMDLLMRLQEEARAAGGQMHVVLGNHEAMGLLGDLRYVTREEFASFADLEMAADREAARRSWGDGNCAAPCAAFDERFPPGYFGHLAAFAPDGRYGRWLLSLPVAIRINDTLYMHGGPSRVVLGMDLPQLNTRYRTALVEYLGLAAQLSKAGLLRAEDEYGDQPRLALERLNAATQPSPDLGEVVGRFQVAARHPLLADDGPNWYRGLALCHEVSEADVLVPVLKQFNVARVVVGHTPTRDARVVSRFDGRFIKLDTGMNPVAYRGVPSALVLQPSGISVRYAGMPEPAQVAAEGMFVAPSQLEEAVVVEALSGALSVTASRGADEQDVSATSGRRTVPAVFQTRARDVARREVAAWRLDRLLGLGIVPVTAERELDGRKGVAQARPRRWLSQAQMRPGAVAGSQCAAEPQFQLMYALDTLTGNEARTAASILYDADNGMVYATSFARAFGQGKGLPAWLRARPPNPGQELRRRLALLDAAGLAKALGDLLDENARKAILARRDALLALPVAAQR